MTEMGRSVTEMLDDVRKPEAERVELIVEPLKNDKNFFTGYLHIGELVRCRNCRWSRPRTLKGETGYRCVFYRVDKAEDGYCDCGEREDE